MLTEFLIYAGLALAVLLPGAVLTGGILGTATGKVGAIVTATWKGINYARQYVIPANPNTAAQQTQRTFFASVINAGSKILTTIVQPYWNPSYPNIGGWAGFCQYNLDNMSTPFDYADLVVSRGNIQAETITSAIYATNQVTLEWAESTLGDALSTDVAVAVVYDEVNNVVFVNDLGSVSRADESIIVTVGAGRTPADLKAFLFFRRGADESLELSDSDFHQVT